MITLVLEMAMRVVVVVIVMMEGLGMLMDHRLCDAFQVINRG